MINIPTEYWYGIKYFRGSSLRPLTTVDYFKCLIDLKPLFTQSDFNNSTPVFYLNMRTHEMKDGGDNGNSVRLCYFSVNPKSTEDIVECFIKNNQDKIGIYTFQGDIKKVDNRDPKSSYLIDEPRFIKFLAVYTQIGLDLLAPTVLLSSRLIISQYMKALRTGLIINPRALFEDFLNQRSVFFRNILNEKERDQLWDDLRNCQSSERCFPHFLANMMAVYDDGRLL